MNVIEGRWQLLARGYAPIPVIGKIPPMEGWQTKLTVGRDEIARWSTNFPSARNTGVLTRVTPAIDFDIINTEAAEACEELARERFEERGHFLVRIGKPPKRAVVFRTDAPFKKLVAKFTAPNGNSSQRIEILGDGQQLVVHGVHPDTKQPYRWHGGKPWNTAAEELPYICEDIARSFVDEVTKLLVDQFGYALIRPPPPTIALPTYSPSLSPRHILRKLDGLIRTLAYAHEGERNAITYWAACRVAEMVSGGELARNEAIHKVVGAAVLAGLSSREAHQTTVSAFKKILGT